MINVSQKREFVPHVPEETAELVKLVSQGCCTRPCETDSTKSTCTSAVRCCTRSCETNFTNSAVSFNS